MLLGEAQTPAGMRLYAIGDVHGCDDLLAAVHRKIAADLAARPVGDHRIIHLGDYVDRGPNSAAVVERLVELTARDERVLCLRGNHEAMLLDFLEDPFEGGQAFLGNSGDKTLASYGVPIEAGGLSSMRDIIGLLYTTLQVLPVEHRQFIARLPYSFRFGDFFFCHAGVRPGVPLDEQSEHDLLWIREPFHSSNVDFGAVVVHGHTPVKAPEICPNRIDIDTGAVLGGPLTCLALEGAEYRFL
jgi:serine/threonine protein phosphatase 1